MASPSCWSWQAACAPWIQAKCVRPMFHERSSTHQPCVCVCVLVCLLVCLFACLFVWLFDGLFACLCSLARFLSCLLVCVVGSSFLPQTARASARPKPRQLQPLATTRCFLGLAPLKLCALKTDPELPKPKLKRTGSCLNGTSLAGKNPSQNPRRSICSSWGRWTSKSKSVSPQ